MLTKSRTRWNLLGLVTATVAVTIGLQAPTVAAAAPLTVAQAISQQSGATATVRGYVVGQPTATTTVVRSNFPSDYAMALADSASETGTSRMIYVQITSAFRANYGLRTNPSLMGKQLDVTGTLSSYFSHPGLVSTTAFAPAGGTPTTTTTPPTTGTPGDYDDTYYKTAIGKTGPALKTELNRIISTQTKLSYDQVWNALKATDQDPANSANVILLYSGRSQSKTTNGGDPDDWNREHVWAKSHGDFGTATGPGTDIHHLRPEDVSVNANRGNKDFDLGGSPAAEAPGSYTDADSWEPRNAVKGDVARMIFYMAVRYAGTDGFADLELNDSVNNGTAPYHGKLSVLKQWNTQDPPDAFEKRRNQVIYDQFQRNRNPFIDHPEWANAIWN
ncbi:Endonuclease I [Actinokineospora alba]|uniref:Endonuclease I n=1 Tax=Actinokineospora alba TaxID=504798 RepID=A0A1H0TVQ5_9PSEU|nr:endonuclease I [Actinokineospora alba]SDJ15054.1 Endonuclease I [Actinokineospora alba]SDP58024.1 Endonuclease I [Actinokineospora alba]